MLTGNEAESQGLDVIVLMAGLPGTGKTTVARELASQVSGTILSKDEIRIRSSSAATWNTQASRTTSAWE
jgi:predicted kinase